MKVLVTGGRDYTNQAKLFSVLNKIHADTPISILIHGDARGADTLAKTWAIIRGVEQIPYPAKWDTWGKSAGFLRNKDMLHKEKPDLVVGFSGGPGTKNMLELAEKSKRTLSYPATILIVED